MGPSLDTLAVAAISVFSWYNPACFWHCTILLSTAPTMLGISVDQHLAPQAASTLNLEIEKTNDTFLQMFPYGLNRHGYAECRRRTFWSCYIMDRFSGFCSGHLTVIQPEDVF